MKFASKKKPSAAKAATLATAKAAAPRLGKWRADQLLRLVRSSDLTREELRIGAYLIARLSPKNTSRSISQVEIAEALGMKQPNVSRGIGALSDLNILEVTPKGRSKAYRLTPCDPETPKNS